MVTEGHQHAQPLFQRFFPLWRPVTSKNFACGGLLSSVFMKKCSAALIHVLFFFFHVDYVARLQQLSCDLLSNYFLFLLIFLFLSFVYLRNISQGLKAITIVVTIFVNQ